MNKKIIDHHMHTNYSPDARRDCTMENYIKLAKNKKIEGLMFTDHVDFDFPSNIFDEIIDYNQYLKEINELKKLHQIDIYMGVEMGYQPHLNDRITKFLSNHPFDFVICSIHVGDGLDFYNGDFFKGKTQEEAYQRYFEIVLNTVKSFNDYDVFGHIDYIIRYGGYENRNYDFVKHQNTIDQALIEIIKNDKGIELNTSGIRYKLGVIHPGITLLKRYKELGGKIVTFGSDCHNLNDYYADFELAKKMLLEAGFEYISIFKNRKAEFIKLVD
jgi:histidinol-phosphatase (PHP family)